jgi:hypothetical protein
MKVKNLQPFLPLTGTAMKSLDAPLLFANSRLNCNFLRLTNTLAFAQNVILAKALVCS